MSRKGMIYLSSLILMLLPTLVSAADLPAVAAPVAPTKAAASAEAPTKPAAAPSGGPAAPAVAPSGAEPAATTPGAAGGKPTKSSTTSTLLPGVTDKLAGFLDAFEYDARGRRDPFAQPLPDRPIAPGDLHGPAMPSQKVSIDELKVIAILWDVREPKAILFDAKARRRLWFRLIPKSVPTMGMLPPFVKVKWYLLRSKTKADVQSRFRE
jgi:hypothetical protein